MSTDTELLRLYKKQNPAKYKLKFGDKKPEEVVLAKNQPLDAGRVKVDVRQPATIEAEFEEQGPKVLNLNTDEIPEHLLKNG